MSHFPVYQYVIKMVLVQKLHCHCNCEIFKLDLEKFHHQIEFLWADCTGSERGCSDSVLLSTCVFAPLFMLLTVLMTSEIRAWKQCSQRGHIPPQPPCPFGDTAKTAFVFPEFAGCYSMILLWGLSVGSLEIPHTPETSHLELCWQRKGSLCLCFICCWKSSFSCPEHFAICVWLLSSEGPSYYQPTLLGET